MSSTKQTKTSWLKLIGINLLILLVILLCLEAAYRAKQYHAGAFVEHENFIDFRVGNAVYGIFDDKYGVKYPPNTKFRLFSVKQGKVVWCPDAISISNEDGINGRTTIAEYDKSDIKILAFGDSVTHWNQNGSTWPDLVETKLSKNLNRDVRILNYGRGTYGILQMFDLAADMMGKHQPDLAIIAFVGSDLTRNRWWTKTREINGYKRPLLSPSKDNFDLSIATDEYLVSPLVNLDWCRESINKKGNNTVLTEVIDQFRDVKNSFMGKKEFPSVFSIDQSFLFNRLYHGVPFLWKSVIPRIDYDDFRQDKSFLAKIEKIKRTGIPYILIYIPHHQEIEESGYLLNAQQTSLLNSLSAATGKKLNYLYEYIDKEKVPSKIDLMPHDPHPNFDGLKLYSDAIHELLVREKLLDKK